MIPQGYCLERGKIMPESIFFSDKTLLKDSKKTKIIEVHLWLDTNHVINALQFFYENEKGKIIEGIQPLNVAPSLHH